MSISREDVLHIAALCRIGLTDEEVADLPDKLSQVLQMFQVLEELDTTNVPPTGHSASLETVMREDASQDSSPRDQILSNVPRLEGDLIRVRAVLE